MSNSENALTTTNAATPATELDALSIEQLTMEAKFYYVQMGQNAVEFGKRLIAIKKKLPHGEWLNWLKENFQLKKSTAANFMAIAERFSNFQTFGNLGYSQLIQMLALPEGEEEKFIAEKAAEGKPVENMTIKQEREEIKKYKAKIAQLDNDNQKLQAENDQLTSINHTLRLENEAFKDQEPQIIETVKTITPPDYVATVQRAEDLQQQVDRLLARQEDAQKTIADLQDQVLEAVSKQGEPPADYLQLEKKLSDMQFELADAKSEARNAIGILAAEKDIEQLFKSAAALTSSTNYLQALKNYMQKHPNTKDKIEMLRCIYEQLDGACTSILEKIK